MDFNLKIYKQLKIKHYFKTINFFFFFHDAALNNESWIKIEQIFSNYKLQYFRVFNTLIKNTLKASIFKNLNILIHGPIILLNTRINKLTLKKIEKNIPLISLLCLKLNNKLYSNKQIEKMTNFSYIKNVYFLYKSLDRFVKKPYITFKNITPKSISK